MQSWPIIVGAVFLAVALISLLPASWAPWVFFGVVGIALLVYGFLKR